MNTSLIYVKCLLIESKEDAIKNQSSQVLEKAYSLINRWFGFNEQYMENIQNVKDHLYQKNYQKQNGLESMMRHEQSTNTRLKI